MNEGNNKFKKHFFVKVSKKYYRNYIFLQSYLTSLPRRRLILETKCNIPCTYYEYELIDKIDTSVDVGMNKNGHGKVFTLFLGHLV